MAADIDARVREILSSYAGDGTNVAWLLCDRHPPESLALTVVNEDLSTTRLTYADLTESSRRFAQVLTDHGIGRGDRVATLMGKSTDLVTVLLGIWRVGAVYVPLFTAFAEDAVTSRLANSETRLVVVDAQYRSKISSDGAWDILVSGDGADTLTALLVSTPADARPSASVGGDGPLVHMFTSGTTGTPKGVIHPVRYIAGWHSYLEFALGVRGDSVFWCAADPGWAYGLYTAIIAPLAAGVPTILTRGGFSAASTWSVLSQLEVTDYAAAPTVYRGLRAETLTRPDTLALRRLSSAGEPLTPEVNLWAEKELGLLVHDHYGQTELGMPAGFPHHPDVAVPVVSGAMGVALPGWTLKLLENDRDEPAPAGTVGRLAVVVADSPLMTFTEYAGGRGDAGRFTTDKNYFLTGDTASIDADGILHFSSRDDDVIIMAGYRIGPFDVESVLAQHPAVRECAVVAAPDEVRGEVIEAYVITAPDHDQDPGDALAHELQQWVKTKYAAHAYPRRVHFVDTLPKTPSGKIQRAQLRQQRRAELSRQEAHS
ncbi:AMP-binding protein [Rhodococcus oxybenzonivorans]|uniref:AMP-binding protein n=1 Tax=Rhodococcus oxybenzonivorans TaxID=1990687 RepID=UPI002954415D|nr:AMP-binding protein [Rhodococcus oxybenzonivorans]MDV7344672.1 AMP-binding protein [Rhodococcus oxybenzonivorans]